MDRIFFYDRTINTDDLLYNHKVNVEQFIKHYSIRYRKKKFTNLIYFEKEMFKYYVIKAEMIKTRRVYICIHQKHRQSAQPIL